MTSASLPRSVWSSIWPIIRTLSCLLRTSRSASCTAAVKRNGSLAHPVLPPSAIVTLCTAVDCATSEMVLVPP